MAKKDLQGIPTIIEYDDYAHAIKTIVFWDDNKKIKTMHSEELIKLNQKLDKCWAIKRAYHAQNNKLNHDPYENNKKSNSRKT